jgi:putative ABC transport system permease protein
VRTRGIAPASLTGRLREITAAVDPSLWYESIRPFVEVDRHQRTAVRLAALLIAAVATSVVLLSAAGIYALMSCVVTQRRREIGIRTALGATPRRIVGAVLARACAQLGLGLALGLGAAALMDVLTGGMLLYGKGTLLLPLFAATMLSVGALATLGPARRGLRIQPMEALREE